MITLAVTSTVLAYAAAYGAGMATPKIWTSIKNYFGGSSDPAAK